MRCQKAIVLLFAALLMLVVTMPALAWNGSGLLDSRIKIDQRSHPWQDENDNDPEPQFDLVSVIPIGPIVFTINVKLPAFVSGFFLNQQPAGARTYKVAPTHVKFQPSTVSGRNEVR